MISLVLAMMEQTLKLRWAHTVLVVAPSSLVGLKTSYGHRQGGFSTSKKLQTKNCYSNDLATIENGTAT